jgi:hypothetical protein
VSSVTIRPTIASDLSAVVDEELPFRIRALTVLDGERVLGVGGLAFPPDGPVWAFVQQAPDAKRFPIAFHRAGLMAVKMIRDSGLSEIAATADADNQAALRWLKRLGFLAARERNIDGKVLFFWIPDGNAG